MLKRLPALRPWLIHHWFLLANSLFWLVTGLEAYATATVLQSHVYQLPAFVLLRVVRGARLAVLRLAAPGSAAAAGLA